LPISCRRTCSSRPRATRCKMPTKRSEEWVSEFCNLIHSGFFTGRFHYFSSAMLIMGFMSGSFLGQQMQFVEYTPKYLCSNNTDFSDPYVCVADASKSSNASIPNWCSLERENIYVLHKVDYRDELSLKNWIEDLSLQCSRQGFTGPIALLGSL